MWHVRTLNRITIGSLGRHSDRPVIGGDLVDDHTSWLRATDTDVQSVNTGTHSAWRKASDRTLWKRIVDTATLLNGARR